MNSAAREMQCEKREEDRRKPKKKTGVEQMVFLCRGGEMVGGSGQTRKISGETHGVE